MKSIAASRMSLARAPAELWPNVRPAGIFDPDAPSGKLGRDPARNRRVGRNERRGLSRSLQRLAHSDRERQGFFMLVIGDDDGNALKRRG